MSMAEVRWAAGHDAYRIARVSSLSTASAQIVILTGISQVCIALLQSVMNTLPQGVAIDSFEIEPNILTEIASGRVRQTERDDEDDEEA
jgi:hypothetical protein